MWLLVFVSCPEYLDAPLPKLFWRFQARDAQDPMPPCTWWIPPIVFARLCIKFRFQLQFLPQIPVFVYPALSSLYELQRNKFLSWGTLTPFPLRKYKTSLTWNCILRTSRDQSLHLPPSPEAFKFHYRTDNTLLFPWHLTYVGGGIGWSQ